LPALRLPNADLYKFLLISSALLIVLDYLVDAALYKPEDSPVAQFLEDLAVKRTWRCAYTYARECCKAFSAVSKAYKQDVKSSKIDAVAFSYA
jgi:hypothetical protein